METDLLLFMAAKRKQICELFEEMFVVLYCETVEIIS